MSEWIDVAERLPKQGERVFIYLKCQTGAHRLVAYDWPYPCCQVNIAYYRPNLWYDDDGHYDWVFSGEGGAAVVRLTVTHWMPLPDLPNPKTPQ